VLDAVDALFLQRSDYPLEQTGLLGAMRCDELLAQPIAADEGGACPAGKNQPAVRPPYESARHLAQAAAPVDQGRGCFLDDDELAGRRRLAGACAPAGTRWDYYWTGELDMQRNTIPRLYVLGPGALACTGLSGRGVPTGTMLGGILADWAEGVQESELALPVERLKSAPSYMSFAPGMVLRWYNLQDRMAAMRDGVELPPHA